MFGLPLRGCVLVRYYNRDLTSPTSVLAAALLTWSLPDKIVRAKLKKKTPPEVVNLPFFGNDDEVSVMDAPPDGKAVWIGYKSGRIAVLPYALDHKDCSLTPALGGVTSLFGHSSEVLSLTSCPEFGVTVSIGEDRSAVLWDLRHPQYIRTLLRGTCTLCAISRTSGDIALVSAGGTAIGVFSVNGFPYVSESAVEPPVTSVTYSRAAEGVSCNVIATGHATGLIRLWNSWDLSPVRDVPTAQQSPVVAVAFGFDNQHLYAATDDREVVIFEKSDSSGFNQTPKYVNMTDGKSF